MTELRGSTVLLTGAGGELGVMATPAG